MADAREGNTDGEDIRDSEYMEFVPTDREPPTGTAPPRRTEKKCPRCAEFVKAEATACRFCGHCFVPVASPAPPVPPVPAVGPTFVPIAVPVPVGAQPNAAVAVARARIRGRNSFASYLALAGYCLLAFGVVGGIALFSANDPALGTTCLVGGLVSALVLLVAYLAIRTPFTGAECPYCHSLSVRKAGTLSGGSLRCDDCSASFGGASGLPIAGALASLLVLGFMAGGAFFVWRIWLSPEAREAAKKIAQNVSGTPQTIIEETAEVDAGGYKAWSWNLLKNVKVTLQVSVKSGPAVDAYLMNQQDFDEFKKASDKRRGGNFHYRQVVSRQSVREYTDSTVLTTGTWWIVLDSTENAGLLGGGPKSTFYVKLTGEP